MNFALHNAAREGDNAALKALVAQGSSLSVRDKHSRTPLHLSAWAGHLECCKVLVEHGADKSSAAMDDTTALHFAAQKGHADVVRFLLNEGMNQPCCSVIYHFVLQINTQCNPELCCKIILNAGASVNGKTRKGMTPLMFGAQSGKPRNHPPLLYVTLSVHSHQAWCIHQSDTNGATASCAAVTCSIWLTQALSKSISSCIGYDSCSHKHSYNGAEGT